MQGQETHSVAVIMSNPDQSKHLETARMKIRGLWVDLVNLRSEEYAHNSRIPTMTFGTPEQDALRRDFTINSLFYNINEGVVEDLTGRGIADMKQGIIRTPLPPRETFLDGTYGSIRLDTSRWRLTYSCMCRSFEGLEGGSIRLEIWVFSRAQLGSSSKRRKGTLHIRS
jgi:hypothetical protein